MLGSVESNELGVVESSFDFMNISLGDLDDVNISKEEPIIYDEYFSGSVRVNKPVKVILNKWSIPPKADSLNAQRAVIFSIEILVWSDSLIN